MKSLVRDLGFISWKDELATFEDMKSQSYLQGVKVQRAIYNEAYRTVDSTLKKTWNKLFDSLPKDYPPYYSFRWAGHNIVISQQNRYIPTVHIEIINGTRLNVGGVRSYGVDQDCFWCIQDLSEGKEKLTLNVYSKNCKKIKTIQDVGETAAVRDGFLYYLKATDIFWFNELYCQDIHGDNYHIYEEKEQKYVLSILKPKGQEDMFLLRKSALFQDIGLIDEANIRWLAKGFGRKLPITRNAIAFDSLFIENKEKIYYPKGQFLVDVFTRKDVILFIFSRDATQSLYTYTYKTRTWTPLIPPQVCDLHFSENSEHVVFGVPNGPDKVIYINSLLVPVLTKELKGPEYVLESGATPFPWFSVLPNNKPRGLVVCAYGSYGMSMRKHQQRLWLPWLERNFIIASLCVRGGGENGDYWWDSSRTPVRRKYGIRDFVLGLQLLQKRYNCDSTNTIIYGRSAGGFLVTAAATQLLDKIAVVYAAKPYTDLLRTVTNKHALQSVQEEDEFGFIHGEEQVADFVELAKLSPYENVTKQPKVNPVMLLTAGTNDSEVPAAMPLRYVVRLQNNGWKNALCRIEVGEGHFTNRNKERGEAYDGALCESFLNEISERGQFDHLTITHN
jgi:dienelactone hydrolase